MGAVICALGGIAGATFALPFRKIRTKSYESYWFIYALVGLVCFPLMLASITCPHLFDVLANTETKTVWQCIGFGALWGLGGLTWGLMIRYLGIGLGLEAVGVHPHLVDLTLDLRRIVLLGQFFFHVDSPI